MRAVAQRGSSMLPSQWMLLLRISGHGPTRPFHHAWRSVWRRGRRDAILLETPRGGAVGVCVAPVTTKDRCRGTIISSLNPWSAMLGIAKTQTTPPPDSSQQGMTSRTAGRASTGYPPAPGWAFGGPASGVHYGPVDRSQSSSTPFPLTSVAPGFCRLPPRRGLSLQSPEIET